MAPNERLGRDTVSAMHGLAGRTDLGVVNALYAAVYELARRTGQSPRTVLEVCFGDAPSDREWWELLLPFLGEDEAAA